MRDERSIFERIVAREVPCYRLYEDEAVLAFLDVGPVARGHCLVIPKQRYVTLDEVPPEVAAAIGRALPRMVKAVKAATGCAGVNVLQNNGRAAGQEVMHVHFHIIPRYETTADPSMAEMAPQPVGFRFDWPAGKLEQEEAEEMRGKIVAALGG